MGKLIFKVFATVQIIFTLFSCTPSVKISKFYKYNTLNNDFYQTYQNDSLKVSIDFSGAHKYQDLNNSKKIKINKDIWKSLHQAVVPNKSTLVFYSKSRLSKLGCTYYGFLTKKKYVQIGSKKFISYKTSQHNVFSISPIIKYSHSVNTISIIPLLDYCMVFINTISLKDFSSEELELDSTYLARNTFAEISSAMSGLNYEKNSDMKNDLSKLINKNLHDQGSYMKPLINLLKVQIDSFDQLKSFYYQSLLTRISFFDNPDSIKKYQDKYWEYLRSKSMQAISKNEEKVTIGQNVANNFSKLISGQKVIMLNENHYDFTHRFFLYSSLDSLYSLGFRHLCIEDCTQYDTSAYPKRTDGFYIMEPHMANLIRKAKGLGFVIHPYEDTTTILQSNLSQIEKREYNQANNLNKLYNSDKTGKWIIYAGYDHINKKSFMSIYKSCAQYFYELSGVKPFCINQTYFSSLSNSNNYLNNKAQGYYTIDSVSTIYSEQQADLYIINNIKINPWIDTSSTVTQNVYHYIFNPKRNIDSKGNIFVYLRNEYCNLGQLAIPIFITTSVKYEKMNLFLPANDYIAFFTDNDENVIEEYDVKSNGAKQSTR